ncbi:hypothetical protein T07_3124 [Trichinella nelsoni]|uniref:Uncharacterized protein n=1 Tax=Trichinella nelsoni TaxID=6336 RepID=A0A0V0RNK1_9BILA|nr:hypothetical protein T07_3124 [Trichinella nelsoni]
MKENRVAQNKEILNKSAIRFNGVPGERLSCALR